MGLRTARPEYHRRRIMEWMQLNVHSLVQLSEMLVIVGHVSVAW